MTNRTYTVKEVADVLGFSTNSIYTFLKEKRIKGVRIGKTGRFRIPQEELDRLLASTHQPQPRQLQQSAPDSDVRDSSSPSPVPHWVNQMRMQAASNIPSLLDWYIGCSAIIVGASMFLYSIGQQTVLMAIYEPWTQGIRLLFIALGIGYLIQKILYPKQVGWHWAYKWSIIATYVGYSYIAGMNKQTDIMLLAGTQVEFLVLTTLFIMSDKRALSLFIGLSTISGSLLLLVSSFPPGLIIPFSNFLPNLRVGILLWCLSSTVLLFSLWYTNKKQSFGFPLLLFGYAGCAIIFGFGYALNMQWGLAFMAVLTGLFMILVPFWSFFQVGHRAIQKILFIMFGSLLAAFLFVMGLIILYEHLMMNAELKQLKAKVAYGKLYIESVIELANKSFTVEERVTGLPTMIEKKDRESLTLFCRREFEEGNLFRRVLLLDAQGKELAHYPLDASIKSVDFGYRQYVRDVLATGKPVVSDSFESGGTFPQLAVVVATPLVQEKTNQIIGILVGSLDIDAMNMTIQGFASRDAGEYFSVVDRYGKIILSPAVQGRESEIPPRLTQQIQGLPDGELLTTKLYNSKGVLVVSSFTRLDSLGWGIMLSQPLYDTYYSPLGSLFAIALVSLSGISIIIISLLFCRSSQNHRLLNYSSP